jgi:Fungal Zn(2)-Cys(6) binuclear cluster domain
MPPDRGRASKACAACRKIKTRCYESNINGKACLRCERLRVPCSLDVGSNYHQNAADGAEGPSDDRLVFYISGPGVLTRLNEGYLDSNELSPHSLRGLTMPMLEEGLQQQAPLL